MVNGGIKQAGAACEALKMHWRRSIYDNGHMNDV